MRRLSRLMPQLVLARRSAWFLGDCRRTADLELHIVGDQNAIDSSDDVWGEQIQQLGKVTAS